MFQLITYCFIERITLTSKTFCYANDNTDSTTQTQVKGHFNVWLTYGWPKVNLYTIYKCDSFTY